MGKAGNLYKVSGGKTQKLENFNGPEFKWRPIEVAYTILRDITGDNELAHTHANTYRLEVVEGAMTQHSWGITRDDVYDWLESYGLP